VRIVGEAPDIGKQGWTTGHSTSVRGPKLILMGGTVGWEPKTDPKIIEKIDEFSRD
jgi:hypothetical protein